MTTCPSCGARNGPEDRFCFDCGQELHQSTGSGATGERQQGPRDQQEPQQGQRRSGRQPQQSGEYQQEHQQGQRQGGRQPQQSGEYQQGQRRSGRQPQQSGEYQQGQRGQRGDRPPAGAQPRPGRQPRYSLSTLRNVSVGTAVVAVIFLPPVFGAISIFAGYKVYTQYDEALGKQLMALGVGATVAGVALGAYIVTQMG